MTETGMGDRKVFRGEVGYTAGDFLIRRERGIVF